MRRAARQAGERGRRYLKGGSAQVSSMSCASSEKAQRVAASLLVEPFENFANRSARETARRQKACLLGSLGGCFGKPVEFLPPNGLSTGQFSFAQLRTGFLDQRLVHRVLLQFADDPARAQPRRAPM